MVIETYKSLLLSLAEFSVDGLSGQRGSVLPASLFLSLFDFSLDLSNRRATLASFYIWDH